VFSTVLLFREALYGALVIALACSVLGVYVVLRRIVFVGAALAEISSAGIALALWLAGLGITLGGAAKPTVVSLLLTLVAVPLASGTRGRIPPDATIGITYSVAAAVGILPSRKRRPAKRTTSSSRATSWA
jgi:zinc transport system permease protein